MVLLFVLADHHRKNAELRAMCHTDFLDVVPDDVTSLPWYFDVVVEVTHNHMREFFSGPHNITAHLTPAHPTAELPPANSRLANKPPGRVGHHHLLLPCRFVLRYSHHDVVVLCHHKRIIIDVRISAIGIFWPMKISAMPDV